MMYFWGLFFFRFPLSLVGMKGIYVLYGIIAGLLPLALGIVAGELAPHSAAAQLPWFTMITLPVGAIAGLIMAVAA
jgi:hypothetical protein